MEAAQRLHQGDLFLHDEVSATATELGVLFFIQHNDDVPGLQTGLLVPFAWKTDLLPVPHTCTGKQNDSSTTLPKTGTKLWSVIRAFKSHPITTPQSYTHLSDSTVVWSAHQSPMSTQMRDLYTPVLCPLGWSLSCDQQTPVLCPLGWSYSCMISTPSHTFTWVISVTRSAHSNVAWSGSIPQSYVHSGDCSHIQNLCNRNTTITRLPQKSGDRDPTKSVQNCCDPKGESLQQC